MPPPEHSRRRARGGQPDIGQLLQNMEEHALVLLLNGITDIGNVGAIMRSADLFEIALVALPQRRSAGNLSAIERTSVGASQYVPILPVNNAVRFVEQLQSNRFWVFCADMSGEAVATVDLTGRVALVLGSEDRGVNRLVAEKCDRAIAIPTRGHVDSFNVSVAAGILMYEVRRQQGYFQSLAMGS